MAKKQKLGWCRSCKRAMPKTSEYFRTRGVSRLESICWNCWATEEDKSHVRQLETEDNNRRRRARRRQRKFIRMMELHEREFNSVVYFIQRGRLVKIGHTTNLNRRLEQLQQRSRRPLAVIGVVIGSYKREYELHEQFAHLRRYLEWFEAKPELLDWIIANARLL